MFYLLSHVFLYIIECRVTLVKREVGSDFSGHQGLATKAHFAKFAVKIFGPKILSIVSIEVYPVRYVNPTDVPYVCGIAIK
jgi:hypothetical protein